MRWYVGHDCVTTRGGLDSEPTSVVQVTSPARQGAPMHEGRAAPSGKGLEPTYTGGAAASVVRARFRGLAG